MDAVIAPDDPRRDDVRALLERHLAFAIDVTPAGHVHALDVDGLVDPAVTVFTARSNGVLVGIAALKQLDGDHGEVKSMHTTESARGQGVGRALLDHVLTVAAERRYQRVSLETGTMDAFAPARALYTNAGFRPCEPFASYTSNPHSTCMTLALSATARGALGDAEDRDVAIRQATSADTAAILGLWIANGAVIEEGGVDMLTPYLAHLLKTGRVLVAVDGERIVGFGAVVERGGVTHLADLFVDPHRFERGIGRRLLAPLFGDAERRTTFASSDPRALPLYVRSGMTPLWPNLYLDVESSRLPPASAGLACEPAEAETLAALEESWLGLANADDHRFWASLPTARPFVVVDAGEAVAAVYTRPRRTGSRRWINRLTLAPGVDPAPAIVTAWQYAAEGSGIGSCIPGPSPALPVLIAAGARIVDRDTFMTSDPSLFDPIRRVTDGGIV